MGPETRTPRRLKPRTMRTLALALLLPWLAGAAVLHTALESSVPADGDSLEVPPAELRLEYTTDVQLDLSRVRVIGPAGEWTVEGLRYLADDRHDVLVAPLPSDQPPGDYRVAWTTAGPDGHAIHGEFEYRTAGSVGQAAPTPQDSLGSQDPDSVPGATEPELGDESGEVDGVERGPSASDGDPNAGRGATGARWLFYLGIVAVLGSLSFRYVVLPQVLRGGELPEVGKGANQKLWRIAGLGVVALLISAPLRLFYQVQSLYASDGEVPLSAFFQIAAAGPWGKGWLLGMASAALIGAGVLLARPRGERAPGWAVMALGAIFLPLSPVLSGHAWSRDPQMLAAAADFAHVVAAGTWVGGLLCLLFAGLPALRAHGVKEGSGQPGLPGMVAAFSRLAILSVVLLTLTGSINTWLHLEAFSQLWTTPWGRALLAKLAVVGAVLGLGFYNWRFVRPALDETPRAGLLKAPATVELALGVAALVLTAYLVVQPL